MVNQVAPALRHTLGFQDKLHRSSIQPVQIAVKLAEGEQLLLPCSLRVGTNKTVQQFSFDGSSTDGFQNLTSACG